jgi:hypothetical protein
MSDGKTWTMYGGCVGINNDNALFVLVLALHPQTPKHIRGG